MNHLSHIMRGIKPPDFDDPTYVRSCQQSWRGQYIGELKQRKARWLLMVQNAQAGHYGAVLKGRFYDEYPGFDPSVAAALVLMQAAQRVLDLRGATCTESLPPLKLMDRDIEGVAAIRYIASRQWELDEQAAEFADEYVADNEQPRGRREASIPPMPHWQDTPGAFDDMLEAR